MKGLFPFLSCIFAVLQTLAAPAFPKSEPGDLSSYPDFSAETCTKVSPAEFWKQFSHRHAGFNSDDDKDLVFQRYEKLLGQWVDKKFPDANWYHREAKAAFLSLTEYIEQIDGGIKHAAVRAGAVAEWSIYQAESSHYKTPADPAIDGAYQLEVHALEFGNKVGTLQHATVGPMALPPLHAAIDHFIRATAAEKGGAYLDPLRARCYAYYLGTFLDEYEKQLGFAKQTAGTGRSSTFAIFTHPRTQKPFAHPFAVSETSAFAPPRLAT